MYFSKRFTVVLAAAVPLLAASTFATGDVSVLANASSNDDFYVDDYSNDLYGDDDHFYGGDDYFYGEDDDSTPVPTFSPSKQNSPIISFYSNVTLIGVTGLTLLDYQLSSASQQAIILTSAYEMGISENSVLYISTSIASNDAPTGTFLKGIAALDDDVVDSVVAQIYTSVPLSSTDFDDTTSAYNSLVSLLSTSVSDTTYTAQLRAQSDALGATQTISASATHVTSSAETVTPVSKGGSDDDSGELSSAALYGIIGGAAAFGILAAIAVYFFCCRSRQNQEMNKSLFGAEGHKDESESFLSL